MTTDAPLTKDTLSTELRCVECERIVIMERGLIDPPHVICTDCEEKIADVFWEALHA